MHPQSTEPTPRTHYDDDEIDLRELACTLWRSKVLIILCTVVVTALAAAYAYLSTPVYETEAATLPPTPNDLSAYNSIAQLDEALPRLTPDEAYKIFQRHIHSIHLRQTFFVEQYLPAMQEGDTEPTPAQRERLWKRFNKELTIEQPKDTSQTLIRMQGSQPQQLADWVNDYLRQASQRAHQQVLTTLRNSLSTQQDVTKIQIEVLRKSAEEERQNRIVRLEEALTLAEQIDLSTPPDRGNLITSYSGETTYLRGSRALESELALLKERKNNDPYIPELTTLHKKLDLLAKAETEEVSFELASVDNWAPVPEAPIKPKKPLIVALGFILGGILGVFIVLIRAWWNNENSTH